MRAAPALLLALAAAALALACDEVFVPASVLTKFRTLAVRAEPPIVRPGRPVRLEALVFQLDDAPLRTDWFACDPPASPGARTPCDDGPALLALERAARAEALASLELPAGLRWLATASVAEYQAAVAPDRAATAILLHVARAGADLAITRKEVLVSADPTLESTNPGLDAVLVDGRPIAPDFVGRARLGQRTAWAAVATATAADAYVAARPDGALEPRREDVRFRWYTTAGAFGTGFIPPSAAPLLDRFVDAGPPPRDAGPREGGGPSSTNELGWKVTLSMPEAHDPRLGPIRVFVVLLDGRGGTTWAERRVTLIP